MLFQTGLVNKKYNEVWGKLNWWEVWWLNYEKYQRKMSLNENDPFESVYFGERGKDSKNLDLRLAYNSPISISNDKKQHLIDLL